MAMLGRPDVLVGLMVIYDEHFAPGQFVKNSVKALMFEERFGLFKFTSSHQVFHIDPLA